MSSAGDLVEKINKVIKSFEDLDADLAGAIEEAQDAIDKAEALGHHLAIEAFTGIQESLEDLRKPLSELESNTERVRKRVEEFGDD